jgi:hypothetical protein
MWQLMRRLSLCALLAGLVLAIPTSSNATLLPPRSSTITGTLTATGGYMFTIQMPGKAVGVLSALTTVANRISVANYPYIWGGGHGQAGIASVGMRGPGYNGRRRGFDCSGSVAAVLVGAGLWPAGGSVPNDAGVISYLLHRGLIAKGAGSGPREVTLYDHPGVHIFMNINGRFFGTSDGGGRADPAGGPGWLDDSAPDAGARAFRRYHIVGSALKATTNAGDTFAFQFGPGVSVSSYPLGVQVQLVYKTTNAGTMVAQSITPVGEMTATGTVASIASDGTSFTVQSATGQDLTFSASGALANELITGQIAQGDTVSVNYLSIQPATMAAITVTVTATPPTGTTTTTTPTTQGSTVTSPTPPHNTGGAGV